MSPTVLRGTTKYECNAEDEKGRSEKPDPNHAEAPEEGEHDAADTQQLVPRFRNRPDQYLHGPDVVRQLTSAPASMDERFA
jgi:hypothetical protein